MSPLRTAFFLLSCFVVSIKIYTFFFNHNFVLLFSQVTQALINPLCLKAAKKRAMIATRLWKPKPIIKPIIRRPIITKPIIRRRIIRKPVVRLVKVPIFVPKLLGVGGLAKSFTSMLNPLAPSILYPTVRSSNTPSRSRASSRPKIEKSAEEDSKTSNENSSGMNFYVYNIKK